jgi:hypothetical protein
MTLKTPTIIMKRDGGGFIDDRAILRDVKLERFPYVVIFEIIDNSVVVYAVHCTYQHPKRIV